MRAAAKHNMTNYRPKLGLTIIMSIFKSEDL